MQRWQIVVIKGPTHASTARELIGTLRARTLNALNHTRRTVIRKAFDIETSAKVVTKVLDAVLQNVGHKT